VLVAALDKTIAVGLNLIDLTRLSQGSLNQTPPCPPTPFSADPPTAKTPPRPNRVSQPGAVSWLSADPSSQNWLVTDLRQRNQPQQSSGWRATPHKRAALVGKQRQWFDRKDPFGQMCPLSFAFQPQPSNAHNQAITGWRMCLQSQSAATGTTDFYKRKGSNSPAL
jgi:hypothetical protein